MVTTAQSVVEDISQTHFGGFLKKKKTTTLQEQQNNDVCKIVFSTW